MPRMAPSNTKNGITRKAGGFARIELLAVLLATILLPLSAAFAQGTAFTYQGQLLNNGSPANGTYNLTFSLFATNCGGGIIAGPLTNNCIIVSNGLFTVPIDFGPGALIGTANWLEIGVETNLANSFVTLAPRQELTPIPYAIYAESAGSAGSLANGTAVGQSEGDTIGSGDLDSFIGGGFGNTIEAPVNYSIIGGGDNNTIQAGDNESFIGGGTGNSLVTNSPDSAIVGGLDNSISAGWSFIGGGSSNTVNSYGSSIVGGTNNLIADYSFYSCISGGSNNTIGYEYPGVSTSPGSFIGGGMGNQLEGLYSVIGGGIYNSLSSQAVFMGVGGMGNVIAGGYGNDMSFDDGSEYCTIGGGSQNRMGPQFGDGSVIDGGEENEMTYATESAIGGGTHNLVDSFDNAVIGGGYSNRVGNYSRLGDYGAYGSIGGGEDNFVGQFCGTISGGAKNNVTPINLTAFSGQSAGTIGGGISNLVNGLCGTIPGGACNVASNYAFAVGQQAQATNQGAFVWADSQNSPFASTNDDSFNVRASGGVRLYTTSSGSAGAGVYLAAGGSSWTTVSDREAKKNIQPMDYRDVLDKLAQVPVEHWNYKWEADTDVPNIGPMAQDFKHAFYPGRDDKGITTLEFDGVALAAIQGLNQKLKEKDAEIQELKQRVDELKKLVQTLAEKN
jgi:hypothetical protein